MEFQDAKKLRASEPQAVLSGLSRCPQHFMFLDLQSTQIKASIPKQSIKGIWVMTLGTVEVQVSETEAKGRSLRVLCRDCFWGFGVKFVEQTKHRHQHVFVKFSSRRCKDLRIESLELAATWAAGIGMHLAASLASARSCISLLSSSTSCCEIVCVARTFTEFHLHIYICRYTEI